MKLLQLPNPPVPLNPIVQGLALFSIGLGLAELLKPRQVSRSAGMTDNDTLLRGYGLREIATGIGLLVARNPKPWLWGRVAGDVLDVATVVSTADTSKPTRLGGSFAALLGVGLLDLYAAIQASRSMFPARTYQNSGRDYSRRSGFPREPEAMRGAARKKPNQASRAAAAE